MQFLVSTKLGSSKNWWEDETFYIANIPHVFSDKFVKSLDFLSAELKRTQKHYTLNDCSQGKHLFCFPRISMFLKTKPKETLRFEGIKTDVSLVSSHYLFWFIAQKNKQQLLNSPALERDARQQCPPVGQQFSRC